MRLRALTAATVAALVLLVAPGVAAGHVTVQPPAADQGSYAKLTFRVPNERPAGTVALRVQMPEDHPFASVSVKPLPGWTAEVARRTLDTPIDAHGRQITEVVSEIRWTGGVIEPGQFQEFEISVGPLPEDTDQLDFPAIQTYADGEDVAWIQTASAGAPEPERPAPTLRLVGATEPSTGDVTTSSAPSSTDEPVGAGADDGPEALAVVSVVVAAAALALSIVALVRTRAPGA
jgi:uncharacterized protein YcnI